MFYDSIPWCGVQKNASADLLGLTLLSPSAVCAEIEQGRPDDCREFLRSFGNDAIMYTLTHAR